MPPGRGRKTAPAEPGPNGKKKKKNVKEIDGILWLLNAEGTPLKKVRKKASGGEQAAAASPTRKTKPKKNIAEIDGQLFLLDENGNPSKKLRKKGEKIQRGKSMGRLNRRNPNAPRSPPRRAKSQPPGRQLGDAPGGLQRQTSKFQKQEYIDDKGRRVIIEEDGTKVVIDKNGKRLRPKKKKNAPPALPPRVSDDDSVLFGGTGLNDNFLNGMPTSAVRESGMFDKLWDDGASVLGGGGSSPAKRASAPAVRAGKGASDGTQQTSGDDSKQSTSLSAKISEISKENRELSLKLLTAEEEIQDVSEQHKKEKAKNVKAMTDMMQLKADYTEASSEIHALRTKVRDLESTIDGKDKQISLLKEKAADATAAAAIAEGAKQGSGDGAGGKNFHEVELLYEENRGLQRKLEFERSNSHQDTKKAEEKIKFMSKELSHLREELDMVLKGEKEGFTSANPTFLRVMNERKALQEQLEQEKEKSRIRVESMEEALASLEKTNRSLRKGEGGRRPSATEMDEASIDFITGLPRNAKDKKDAADIKAREKDPKDRKSLNKHIGEIQVNFSNSYVDNNNSANKRWFKFGK